MVLVYAEKEDMGIRYAAALGGINYNGITVTTDNLSDYIQNIKKEIADKKGYLETYYKGKLYVVTWGWGHFGTLKDIKDYNPEYDKWYKIPLPFIPAKYEAKRIENSNEFFKRRDDRQFALVTKMFNSDKTDYIVNATDWEREGELIFAYVYDLTKTNKPYYRLRNTAKTEKEIRKAFDNLVDSRENYPYVLAARARSMADWAIGINMTIAATLYLSKDKSLLNVGRVMTPTLNLIVQREKEIQNFVEKTSYGVEGIFKLPSGETYTGKLDSDLFNTKEDAETFISNLTNSGKVISVETKTEKKKPPLLHNTNTLQIEANEKYGYTLEETLNIAQKLYENGFITYPRVDSQYLTEDKKTEIPNLLAKLMSTNRYKEFTGPTVMPDRYFNNAKIDGHDAIIITDTMPTKLNKEQLDIYDLVARRMLMTVALDMEIEKTTVLTEVPDNTETHIFKSIGTRYANEGWSKIVVNKKETKDTLLPIINKNDAVSASYNVYEQISKPPQRYTDATLIKAMENCGRKVEDEEAKEYLKRSKGIGRPATRASLVERLITADYIKRKNKQLVPTDKGMTTIDLITIEEIKSPILTADWEKSLDVIEVSSPSESLSELRKFVGSINSAAKKWCEEIQANKVESTGGNDLGIKCPVCGMPMVEGKDNYFCSGYKDGCKMSVKKELCHKKINKTTVKTLIEKGETSIIKNFKSKDGKKFDASLILVDAYKCEKCGTIQTPGEKCYKCKNKISPDLTGRKLVNMKF